MNFRYSLPAADIFSSKLGDLISSPLRYKGFINAFAKYRLASERKLLIALSIDLSF